MSQDDTHHPCQLVWRKANRIGVRSTLHLSDLWKIPSSIGLATDCRKDLADFGFARRLRTASRDCGLTTADADPIAPCIRQLIESARCIRDWISKLLRVEGGPLVHRDSNEVAHPIGSTRILASSTSTVADLGGRIHRFTGADEVLNFTEPIGLRKVRSWPVAQMIFADRQLPPDHSLSSRECVET